MAAQLKLVRRKFTRATDIDTLDLISIVGKQGFERFQIVAFNEKVAGVRIASRERPIAAEQPVGNLIVMIDDGLATDPV